MFYTELTAGIRRSGVKAGVIKVATGDPDISDYESTVFKAAVKVAGETGVSIITHTEADTVGPAQQDLFLRYGADPSRVMIGHQNNSEDIDYARNQLAKPGFYLGFDRTNPLMSAASEDNIVSLVAQGFGDRIMLSHDCIFMWLGRADKWDKWPFLEMPFQPGFSGLPIKPFYVNFQELTPIFRCILLQVRREKANNLRTFTLSTGLRPLQDSTLD